MLTFGLDVVTGEVGPAADAAMVATRAAERVVAMATNREFCMVRFSAIHRRNDRRFRTLTADYKIPKKSLTAWLYFPQSAVTLEPEIAEFLAQGLSIHMATRNARLEPHGVRVVAALVDTDDAGDSYVTAFVPAADAAPMLANLNNNGQVALAFARPADDRAFQVKGESVDVRQAAPTERAAVQDQWQRFQAQMQMIGIPPEATVGWGTWPCMAIRLRVVAVFDQTPGPGAGARLAGPSRRPSPEPLGIMPAPIAAATPLSPPLETLTSCFQGIIPAVLCTCSADGLPNVAYISYVDFVDIRHVALSFQFFNKSRRNIAENPQALILVTDPDTRQGWTLDLRYARSESSGPVFDRMFLRIEAIASYTGLKGIFRLRAADIYQVAAIREIAGERGHTGDTAVRARRAVPESVFTMTALQDLLQRINAADCLETLLESILEGIEEFFGFRHSMILLAAEEPGVLVTIAARGYEGEAAGAEARFGEGIAGVVAEAQKPIRISGLLSGMLYALAVRTRAEERGWKAECGRVTMPGLQNPDSQLGIPLVVRTELIGVLVIESESTYRFHEEDKTTIELLGSYLAIAIQNRQLQESAESSAHAEPDAPASITSSSPEPSAQPVSFAFHVADEVVLANGEYLIRGLPAKIFWKLLRTHAADGRREFTNRELRLDKSLGLPDFKDNLETRLLLLRRRLEQKTPGVRIVPSARGRFRLDLTASVSLTEH
jgi:hypothetical protein